MLSSVSDDDEIDYSIKPEFYGPELDFKDELWVQKKRKGSYSDAVLSCPTCFTTLTLECQRYVIGLLELLIYKFVVQQMFHDMRFVLFYLSCGEAVLVFNCFLTL